MTEPSAPPPRGSTGAATVLGVLLALPLIFGVASAVPDAGVVPVLAVAAVGAIVLVARGSGPWRGLGIGILVGFAIVLLLYGALFAICSTP